MSFSDSIWCKRSVITLRLHQMLSEKLNQTPSLSTLYRELEMPLVPVLSRIERNGALVCRNTLAAHSQELGERILSLETKALVSSDKMRSPNSWL